MKIWLEVPFENVGSAKALGARFDMAKRQWYVPDGLDAMDFVKWLPDEWRDFGNRLQAVEKAGKRRRAS